MAAVSVLLFLAAAAVIGPTSPSPKATSPAPHWAPATMRLVQTIPMPGVEGRIDHLALDPIGARLFLAAIGNGSVEVVALGAGARVRSLSGFREPQGIAYLPESGELVVACGGDGALVFLDGRTFEWKRRVDLGEDADNIRLDPVAQRLYAGFGKGGLAIVDARGGKKLAEIPLPAHPEAFLIDSGRRVAYVNVPGADQIAVVDLERKAMSASWPLSEARANFPMALDPIRGRLFAGCRRPARILVFDLPGGSILSRMDAPGDVDDIFWDRARGRLYATGGEGFLDVFTEESDGRWNRTERVPTAPGARTSLFDEGRGRLYVAAPRGGGRDAALLVYEAGPVPR